MNKNKNKLKCLFGFHNFFTRGCVRQCEDCGLLQIFEATRNGEECWIDIVQNPKYKYNLKDNIDNNFGV